MHGRAEVDLPALVLPSTDTIGMLRELVEALDRRIPNVERADETQIASDAAALRKAAVHRIEELSRAVVDHFETRRPSS
jgi:hypothetical protein